MTNLVPIGRALISVSDKSGLIWTWRGRLAAIAGSS